MEPSPKHPPTPVLRLYRINAGSCNGCDVELAVTASVSRFDVGSLGCSYTEDPADADIVIITGPLTARVKEKVLHHYAEVPEPNVTVLVGICPISGGVFRDSYAVSGPIDRYLPVDVNVPGCPPHPQAIVAGIAEAAALRRAKRDSKLPSPATVTPAYRDKDTTEPANARGRMRFNAAACVGCRMCEHVCAGGAIRFDEVDSGLTFTLWHNSCALCGLCSHYCPTKALTATGEWHMAHRQEEKYRLVEQGVIPLVPCTGCGTPMVPVAAELLKISYRGMSRETDRLKTLCTECRQKESIGGLRR